MIFNGNKMATLLSTLGAIGGVYYGMKRESGFWGTAMWAIGFGLMGGIVGNTISKLGE
jgi:hypothetical protein